MVAHVTACAAAAPGGPPRSPHTGASVPQWLREHNAAFCASFNAGRHSDVGRMYLPGAWLIPPVGPPALVPHPHIAAFWEGMARGPGHPPMCNLVLTPYYAYTDGAGAVHELGTASHSLGGGPYYCRWERATEGWGIAHECVAASAGPPPAREAPAPAQPGGPATPQPGDADASKMVRFMSVRGLPKGKSLLPAAADWRRSASCGNCGSGASCQRKGKRSCAGNSPLATRSGVTGRRDALHPLPSPAVRRSRSIRARSILHLAIYRPRTV